MIQFSSLHFFEFDKNEGSPAVNSPPIRLKTSLKIQKNLQYNLWLTDSGERHHPCIESFNSSQQTTHVKTGLAPMCTLHTYVR
jgi:hypothetical protein